MKAAPLFDPSTEEIQAGIARDLERIPSRYDRDDITASRHRGNRESEAAHDSIRESKERTRLRILEFLQSRGEYGATWEEIALALGLRYANSGRLSELKAEKPCRIVVTDRTRKTTSGHEAGVVMAAGIGK